MVPDEMEKGATRSNLPPGFTFCNPEMGFDHGSLKSPDGVTDLLHYTEVDESLQTVYLLAVTNLFKAYSTQLLQLIIVKHHIKERWYFADGAILSADVVTLHATFLRYHFTAGGLDPWKK